MEQSDRDIGQWDARLKQQLERKFHNYHKHTIDLSIARVNEKLNWTGETIIVEKVSSSDAIATIRLLFDDAGLLNLEENVEINSIFNRVYITNTAQPDAWIDVIYGINFEYKKKIAEGGLVYVSRGDVAEYDFEVGDLITDGTWRVLDISSIVPPQAILIDGRIEVSDNLTSQAVYLRPYGHVNVKNRSSVITQVSGITVVANFSLVIYDQRIEYFASNTVWTAITIQPFGWWE